MTFEQFKKSGDVLHAKLLEAQSVDTYWGWAREFMRGARLAGLGPGCQFTMATGPDGRPLADQALDQQVLGTYLHGLQGKPEALLFLEIEPEKQATNQNLAFLADAMSQGPGRRPAILDPRDLEIRGGQLFVRKKGQERQILKVVSRIVDFDLKAFIKARTAEKDLASIELFQRIYAVGDVFPDLSKHLAGFYLIDKSSLTEMSLLGQVSVAPKTEVITPAHLERYRRNPGLLKGLAIKPLHGMSAKGVYVRPTLQQVQDTTAQEQMLAQEIIWATPLQPNVCPEIGDPDVQAGICSEARLVLHAGSAAVPEHPHRARTIAGLSRSHFQSADPDRKIKDDPKGRGWYSNMGAILAVKAELGITTKDDAGIGMSPIYWLD
jgi:hypothetical protein